MANYIYDHNTAHILEPVQGYDLVSHMCFFAPLQNDDTNGKKVEDAVPGLVLHRNPVDGKLETGLLPDSMAQFLCSKQDTEDVMQQAWTKNGQKFIGVGTLSYGGFNTAPYQGNGYSEGVASNAGNIQSWDPNNANYGKVSLSPTESAFTTFPGACGLELGSSEFARFQDNGTTEVTYTYDMPLTSPVANKTYVAATGLDGEIPQIQQGGFLKPGTNYVDPICGILSQKPFRNENGTWMIRFWAVHQPVVNLTNVLGLDATTDASKTVTLATDANGAIVASAS